MEKIKGYSPHEQHLKSIITRFEEKIERVPECGCWIWLGATNNKGYGQFYDPNMRKHVLAHRFSFEISFHKIPDGLNALHRCDTRSCVNPHHLFLGTLKDNMVDCSKKGRIHVNWPIRSGNKHHNCKLSDKDVMSIRERREKGESGKKLSEEYGVHRQYIYDISCGKERLLVGGNIK